MGISEKSERRVKICGSLASPPSPPKNNMNTHVCRVIIICLCWLLKYIIIQQMQAVRLRYIVLSAGLGAIKKCKKRKDQEVLWHLHNEWKGRTPATLIRFIGSITVFRIQAPLAMTLKWDASGLTWLHHRLEKYSWCTAVFTPQIWVMLMRFLL